MSFKNLAAVAPSTDRWSYAKLSGIINLGLIESSAITMGIFRDRPTNKIATSGTLTIGVEYVPPIAPRLLIVKVPPLRSLTA